MKNTNKSDAAENISALDLIALSTEATAKVLKVPTPTLLTNVQVSRLTRFSFCSLASASLDRTRLLQHGKKIDIYSVWLITCCTR
jgi:hypothetical protein